MSRCQVGKPPVNQVRPGQAASLKIALRDLEKKTRAWPIEAGRLLRVKFLPECHFQGCTRDPSSAALLEVTLAGVTGQLDRPGTRIFQRVQASVITKFPSSTRHKRLKHTDFGCWISALTPSHARWQRRWSSRPPGACSGRRGAPRRLPRGIPQCPRLRCQPARRASVKKTRS